MIVKAIPSKDSIYKIQTIFTGHFASMKNRPGDHKLWLSLENDLGKQLKAIAVQSYYDGCREVDASSDVMEVLRMQRQLDSHATTVTHQMRDYTFRELGIKAAASRTEKKASLYGKERAEKSALFEGFKAFYDSKLLAWKRNSLAKKEWVVGNEHAVDDVCDEAEDDGIIPVSEPFSNNFMAPPAHINCSCLLWLHI
jgi:hypothetical protein